MHRRIPFVLAIAAAFAAVGIATSVPAADAEAHRSVTQVAPVAAVIDAPPAAKKPVVVSSSATLPPKQLPELTVTSPQKEVISASNLAPVQKQPTIAAPAVTHVTTPVSAEAVAPRQHTVVDSTDEPTQEEIDAYLKGQAELDAESTQREAAYDAEMAEKEIDEYLKGQAELDAETTQWELDADLGTEPTQEEIDAYLKGQAELDAETAEWEAAYDAEMVEKEEAAKKAALELEAELTKEALAIDAERELAEMNKGGSKK